MSSGGYGGSRVSITADLRKTIQTIREISGKQHSDEDILAVYNDCLNDPYETAQKLVYLDTFHEVRSKKDRKKENVMPATQGSGRSGRRNYSSSYIHSDAGNGRNTAFKRENGSNHVTRGSKSAFPPPNRARNTSVPRAMKTSNDHAGLPNGATGHKTQGEGPTNVKKVSTSGSEDGVETEKSKMSSEIVAEPLTEERSVQISKTAVNNKTAEIQSSSLAECNGQSAQVIAREETAEDKNKTETHVESDVVERQHVTFPVHIQAAKALENGLTFGSFDCNFIKEASSNNGAMEDNPSNLESSQETENNLQEEASPTTDEDPSRQNFIQEKGSEGADNIVPRAEEGSSAKENYPNLEETQEIPNVQNVPPNVFGLVPSYPAPSHSVNTEAGDSQPANSESPNLPYPTTDQTSFAASQQAVHLFRQQYPPNFFPYGPYFPPYYMPHPYIHQYVNPNGIPQQTYLPPGVVPSVKFPFPQVKLGNNAGNPLPVTDPSPYGSSTAAGYNPVPSATAINSNYSDDISISQLKDHIYTTGLPSENAAAWINGQQVSPMYNLALHGGQPLPFQPVQAGHGRFTGIYQPPQPMAAVPPAHPAQQLSRTPPPMAEAVGPPPPIVYHQPPQGAQPNWASNY